MLLALDPVIPGCSQGRLKGSRSWVQHARVCLRVEEPQGQLLQRGLLACLSGSGVEFCYYMTELSPLRRPHPSPMVGPGASLGMSAGRWAGQPLGT